MSLKHYLFGPVIRGYYNGGSKVLYQYSPMEWICDQLIGLIKSGISAYIILISLYLAYQVSKWGYQRIKGIYTGKSTGFHTDSLINRYFVITYLVIVFT